MWMGVILTLFGIQSETKNSEAVLHGGTEPHSGLGEILCERQPFMTIGLSSPQPVLSLSC